MQPTTLIHNHVNVQRFGKGYKDYFEILLPNEIFMLIWMFYFGCCFLPSLLLSCFFLFSQSFAFLFVPSWTTPMRSLALFVQEGTFTSSMCVTRHTTRNTQSIGPSLSPLPVTAVHNIHLNDVNLSIE